MVSKRQFDHINEAAVVIDAIHANIHRGVMYTASMQGAVASSGTMEILIQTGAREVHLQLNGSVSQDMTATLYEATTFSAAGTTVLCRNRNREFPDAALTTITHTPTLTGDGDTLEDQYLPGGQKSSAVGGSGSSFNEWELEPNSVYLARISNTLVSPAAAGHAGVALEFYEPDPDN